MNFSVIITEGETISRSLTRPLPFRFNRVLLNYYFKPEPHIALALLYSFRIIHPYSNQDVSRRVSMIELVSIVVELLMFKFFSFKIFIRNMSPTFLIFYIAYKILVSSYFYKLKIFNDVMN